MNPFAHMLAWLRRDRVTPITADPRAEASHADIRDDQAAFEYVNGDGDVTRMPSLTMTGRWPADLCSHPPCDREDHWVCVHHKPAPAGRHHRDDQTEVISLSEWKDRVR